LLTINTFATGYDRKLIDGYFDQINAKAGRLVIDLHTNGGGAVTNLTHLAGKVLPVKNSMGSFITRFHADEFKKKNPGTKDDPILIAKSSGIAIHPIARRETKTYAGELVVLIGPGSASASEIFAASVEDNKRGKVIGVKSAGAVLASTFMTLPDGFSLQIPMMEYVTAGGKRLEGTGVAPSLAVEVTKLEERAEIVKVATEAFLAIKREGIGVSSGGGGK
jgi:C-terminal processing protease CtpA/Prc